MKTLLLALKYFIIVMCLFVAVEIIVDIIYFLMHKTVGSLVIGLACFICIFTLCYAAAKENEK